LRAEIARDEQALSEFDIDESSSLTGLVADLERRILEAKTKLAELERFTNRNAEPS
jgi:hypothetical protein